MRSPLRRALAIVLIAACAAPVLAPARAQQEFRLDPSGTWQERPDTKPKTPDEQRIADARRALADGRPGRVRDLLDDWLEENQAKPNPMLPPAYLLRGDSWVADAREYKALYDYEEVAINHPGTPEFARAIERELDIGIKYVNGLKRHWLGLRIVDAEDVGQELLVRTQERLPGSPLAERAAIELADYYYRQRDLMAASDAYEIYATNFPTGPNIDKARQRRIFANIGRYKGPNYDTAGLVDAKGLIEDFTARDPVAAQRAGLSDALLAKMDESQAAQLWERSKWYLERRDPVSARATLRRLIRNHPQTVAATQALEEMRTRGWALEDPAAVKPEPVKLEPVPSAAPAGTTPR